MRVLHLIPSLEGGGAERQIAYLARGLADRGGDVHVGILRGGPNLERLHRAGATVHWIRSGGNYDPFLLPRTVRLIRCVNPDVVQTWLTQMDVVGGAAALIARKPWIVSERSSGAHYPRDARHALRRWIGRHADAVIANSKGGLDFWTQSDAAKFVVPNALPLEEIAAAPREELDAGTAKVILFAGRLGEEKNPLTLIDALAEVMRGRDAIALLAGVGPLEGAVRARMEERGITDRVRILGFTDRLWGLMKRADVVVSVSLFEGHPNVVLEAAAAECPLVISDIAAHRAVLAEEAAAFVPPSDAHAIAAAIGKVLDDPAAARARACRARDTVASFSIFSAAENYLRVYDLTDAPLDHR
jgi:glycosyltransferase involved in cell wall biosynthesis